MKRGHTRHPRDDKGRFVPIDCPDVDCDGRLQHVGDGRYECDGLVDPDDPNSELQACGFSHHDGEPHNEPVAALIARLNPTPQTNHEARHGR